jgi:hypothetical protein
MELNKCIFMGKTKTAPQISMKDGQKQAYMKFTLKERLPGANGQYVDVFTDVDIFAVDKKADLFEKYVVRDQELIVECRYINWVVDGVVGHAFKVLNVSFGFRPKSAQLPAQDAPPL